MSTHGSGIDSSRHADAVMSDDVVSATASSAGVQALLEQGTLIRMEGLSIDRPADTRECYAEHSEAYYAYFAQYLSEDEKQEMERSRTAESLSARAEATSLNVPAPPAPPRNYIQMIPKKESFHAMIEVGGQLIGGFVSPTLRTHDVRVQLDAGLKGTPRIDIVVKISDSGKAIDMHIDRGYTELRLRCNAGYRGNGQGQGGIDLPSWSSSATGEPADAKIPPGAVKQAEQLVKEGKFKAEHFHHISFSCKNTHLVGKQKMYLPSVKYHALFKLLHQLEGDHHFTIRWASRAIPLMAKVIRHIHLAVTQNWAPYYVLEQDGVQLLLPPAAAPSFVQNRERAIQDRQDSRSNKKARKD